jgi:tRNA U34 5-methylaminomethyl-2-thiouridine-forming methyltransferase MnmC
MNNNFFPVKTSDGSIGLYNTEVDDIYHSSAGAYTESINKFIMPSGILDYVKENNQVRILDICYGLGYNSKTAAQEILKINPSCKIYIDCLEIDEKVLALSTLISHVNVNINVQKIFNKKLIKNKKIKSLITTLTEESSINEFVDESLIMFTKLYPKPPLKYSRASKTKGFLHNIYYRTHSNRTISSIQRMQNKYHVVVNFFIQDAREAVKKLNGTYNFIFHDGFTPSKLPTLWSMEFLGKLYELLDENGNMTTYTKSVAVRNGLREAGFSSGNIVRNNRSIGTIAYKNKNLVENSFSELEFDILETKAGIPYRDNNLCNTAKIILQKRETEVSASTKEGASRFLKNRGVKTIWKR